MLESAWKFLDGFIVYAEKNPVWALAAGFFSLSHAPSHSLGFSLPPPLSPYFLHCNRFSLETVLHLLRPPLREVSCLLTAAEEAQGRAKPVRVILVHRCALCAKIDEGAGGCLSLGRLCCVPFFRGSSPRGCWGFDFGGSGSSSVRPQLERC